MAAGCRPSVIIYDAESVSPTDSGFVIVSDDDADAEVATEHDYAAVHLGHILEEWPELEDALEHAREHGAWEA